MDAKTQHVSLYSLENKGKILDEKRDIRNLSVRLRFYGTPL